MRRIRVILDKDKGSAVINILGFYGEKRAEIIKLLEKHDIVLRFESEISIEDAERAIKILKRQGFEVEVIEA